ncbi:hypothetical protein MCOR06_007314 [Pyricularia oryzae]|nr:hypothetical protein MCOR01_001741 [Pyricularia oryzae]KAI6585159.1 hypothetical protein MCOR06_007314 [Pyricularia oryzae]
MKVFIATITLPLLAAAANLQPRQTGQATTACPSLWSAVVTSGPPSPTAVLAWRSSLSARATEACMRFGDPDMPDSVMTALASYQDAFSDYLSKDPTASSAYRLCSVWLNEPISLTDASQIASSESRRSVYESCRENGKLSSWWTSSPATASATATQTQTSGTASAAATGGSTTNAGQTAATSAPAGGAAARGTPVATVSVMVAVAFGSLMGWM